MKLTKILFKLTDGNWVHFCYIDERYKNYLPKLNTLVKAWAKKDFGLGLDTLEDINTLKRQIIAYYKKLYPLLVRDSTFDVQGWTRIWVTEHLKGELEDEEKVTD
jgi:hypothetical protein